MTVLRDSRRIGCEMKILYLTEHNPVGAGCGAVSRTYAIWQALKALGDVTTIVFDARSPNRTKRDEAESISHRVLPDLYCGWRRRNWIWLFAWLTGKIDFAFCNRDEVLSALGLEGRDFDIDVVRYFWNLERTAAWKIAPCYLDFDDLPSDSIESTTWRNLSGVALMKDKVRVWLREKVLSRICHGVWLANAEQCTRLSCRGRPADWVPNIAKGPGAGFVMPAQRQPYLLAVGAMGHVPNVEGLRWFLTHVWGDVRQRFPDLSLKLVGKDFSPELKAECEAHAGVSALGFVSDLAPIYANAMALVAPLFFGGGTCIKVLEAQLHGVKVFGTRVALRGFSEAEIASSGAELFENAGDFVSKLGEWMDKGDAEVLSVRRRILEFAERRNSQSWLNGIVHDAVKGIRFMRICYVTTEFADEDTLQPFDGGLARYLWKITHELRARGHDPLVLVTGAKRTHAETCDGISVQYLDKSYSYSLMERIWMRLLPARARSAYESQAMAGKVNRWIEAENKNHKIDLVQYASYFATGRCPLKTIPNCVRISSYAKLWQKNYGYEDPNEIRDEEWQFRRARFLYGPSQYIASHIRADLALKTPIEIIETPYVMKSDVADTSLQDALRGAIGEAPYLLFFGSIGKLKGCDEIAAAVPDVFRRHPALHLVLVGKVMPEPGGLTSLDRIRQQAGDQAARVHWLGRQPHSRLVPLIRGARAVLLPSRIDNLPNTCIEAMGLEKIVIGSRGASFEQLIDDGLSGILCEAGDGGSIADAVDRLMGMNEVEAKRMGAAARRRIDRLHPDVIVPQVLDYYREVVRNWR